MAELFRSTISIRCRSFRCSDDFESSVLNKRRTRTISQTPIFNGVPEEVLSLLSEICTRIGRNEVRLQSTVLEKDFLELCW